MPSVVKDVDVFRTRVDAGGCSAQTPLSTAPIAQSKILLVTMKHVVLNPLVISTLIGMLWSVLSLPMPRPVSAYLGIAKRSSRWLLVLYFTCLLTSATALSPQSRFSCSDMAFSIHQNYVSRVESGLFKSQSAE